MMNGTADLAGEITRGLLALAVVIGYLYLAIAGIAIPESYAPIVAVVVGFYFGTGISGMAARFARLK